MNRTEILKRAEELMDPINRQIMMCDDRHDLLILAFSMINRSKDIMDQHLGEGIRQTLFKEFS